MLLMSFWLVLPLPGCCPTPEAGQRLLQCFRSASGRHPTIDAALQETQKRGSRFRIVGDVLEDVVTVNGDFTTLQSSDLVQCGWFPGSESRGRSGSRGTIAHTGSTSGQLFDCCFRSSWSSNSSMHASTLSRQ